MKCSHCYADNKAWATVCEACGQAVQRLETCPLGHLLPPGGRDCPVCPSLWPEVDAFAGPALLRGLLWVDAGKLAEARAPDRLLAYLEVRDRDRPVSLARRASGRVEVAPEDDPDVVCRLLMRPGGPRVCNKSAPADPRSLPQYVPLPPGSSLDLGEVRLRFLDLAPPAWAEKMAASR